MGSGDHGGTIVGVVASLAVTVLFSRACPSHEEAVALLQAAAREAGVTLDLRLVAVVSDEEAEALRFAGSPTYLADDRDLFPCEGPGHAFQYDACRAYARPGGRIGPLPDRDDLVAALRDAAARTGAG